METSRPRPAAEPAGASETIEPAEAYSEDGIDVSLIRWMLELSPKERLEAAQDMIDTVWMLREPDRRDRELASGVVEGRPLTADPVLQSLVSASPDAEPDDDDFDGGLTESRREARQGLGASHEEAKRELGLP